MGGCLFILVCVPFPAVDICPFVLYKVQTSQSPGGGAKRRIFFKLRVGRGPRFRQSGVPLGIFAHLVKLSGAVSRGLIPIGTTV